MAMLTGVQPAAVATARREQAARVRLALLIGWAVVLTGFVTLGVQPGSLAQLEDAVAAGQVRSVTVTPGVPDGSTGYGVQEVTWRRFGMTRSAQALQVSPGQDVPDDTRRTVQRVSETELGASLQQLDPQLQVVQVPTRTSSFGVLGSRVPGWVALCYVTLFLSTWALILHAPRPWRATRWAWFWIASVPVVGPVAVVLLSGRVAGLGWLPAPRPGRPIVTGGWALLGLCLVLGVLR